jgi:hypothetical protein
MGLNFGLGIVNPDGTFRTTERTRITARPIHDPLISRDSGLSRRPAIADAS